MKRILYFVIDWVLMPVCCLAWILFFAGHGLAALGGITLGLFAGTASAIVVAIFLSALAKERP